MIGPFDNSILLNNRTNLILNPLIHIYLSLKTIILINYSHMFIIYLIPIEVSPTRQTQTKSFLLHCWKWIPKSMVKCCSTESSFTTVIISKPKATSISTFQFFQTFSPQSFTSLLVDRSLSRHKLGHHVSQLLYLNGKFPYRNWLLVQQLKWEK